MGRKYDLPPVARKDGGGIDRFSLFDFAARRNFLWDLFSKINDFYYEHTYSYTISREDDVFLYREFFDGKAVVDLVIKDLAFHMLREMNAKIMGMSDLLEVLKVVDPSVDERSVCTALDRLREKHLVYFGENYGSIVSVIDVDCSDAGPALVAAGR